NWHRLRDWTYGQPQSERLAVQVLINQGFTGLDPSHPLCVKDEARDAVCIKDGKRWVIVVFFPRGQQRFPAIKRKFEADLRGARRNKADGFAFVTNQELSLKERTNLRALWPGALDLYHLERVAAILDTPSMLITRRQFLGIDWQHESN